jgi:hypothetical protein
MEDSMNLHEQPIRFEQMLRATAEHFKIVEAFVEKDYWLSLVLKRLADSPFYKLCVFKGGTSLSKAYQIIQRFSEDVDLAFITEGQSNNQVKKAIDTISKQLTEGLPENYVEGLTSKGSRFRRTAHRYPQISEFPIQSQLSSDLILEINAFANPSPAESKSIQTLFADFCIQTGRENLVSEFGLEPFNIQVLSLSRTLAEKIMAIIRASYHLEPLAQLQEKIRHLYDLHQALQRPDMQAWLASDDLFTLLDAVRADDAKNSEFQGAWAQQPLAQAPLFQASEAFWTGLQRTYQGPFQSLVYGTPPAFADVCHSLHQIGQRLIAYDRHTAN